MNKIQKILLLSLCSFLVIGGALEYQLVHLPKAKASFSFSKSITVQSGKVPSTQTNFPMNVNGTFNGTGSDPDLRTTGNGGGVQNANGYDVGFYSNANCSTGKLNWETVLYTASTGAVEYWVQVTSISDGTIIYICYGDASITTDQSNKTSTWDSNYKTVVHLPNGTTLTATDSTSNGYNGTVPGSGMTAGTGKIDGAGTLNGTHNPLIFTSLPLTTMIASANTHTVSFWVNPVNQTSVPVLWAGNYSNGGDAAAFIELGGVGTLYWGYTGGFRTYTTNTNITNSSWSYVTVTKTASGDNGSLYINGTLQTSWTGTLGNPTSGVGAGTSIFTPFGSADLNGSMDEFRVSDIARTANWITTEYNNQSSPSTFYSFANNSLNAGQSGGVTILKGGVTILNGGVIIK